MFKKSHDQMFRKAQMKFFLMIVSILLAVFIALIGSINVITKAVMRGQSKEVLMQIAAGFEYNDKTATFTYTDPNGPKPMKNDGGKQPPKQNKTEASTTTDEAVTTDEGTTSTEKPSEIVSSAPSTDAPTEQHITEQPVEHQTPNEPEQQQEPQQTEAPHTEAPQPTEAQTVSPDWNNWTQQDWQKFWEQQGAQAQQGWNNWGQQEQQGQQNWNNWSQQDWQKFWEQQGGQNQQGWNNWGQQGQQGQQNWGQQDWNNWTQQDWQRFWEQQNAQNQQGWNPWNPWGGNNTGSLKVRDNEPKSNDKGIKIYEDKRDFKNYKDDTEAENAEAEAAQESTVPDTEPVAEPQSFSGETDGSFGLTNTVYTGEAVLDGFTVLSSTGSSTASTSDSTKVSSAPADGMGFKSVQVEPIPKTLGSIEYFVIMADINGKYLAAFNNDKLSAENAQKYITAILENGGDTDMINSYQFYQTDKQNGTIIVLTDKSSEMDMLTQLKRTTIIIGFIALIILSIFAYFLSVRSIQPIKVAFDKQKQFVSDASHELKTPLAVISTNADVLAGEIGENKWLEYIKTQTDRMNILVNDLLSLTRMENKNFQLERKYFNLSKAVISTALPFECQAFDNNKKFEVNVEDGIMLSGSEKHIKQMVAIFIDNALKYSNDGGTVSVCLKRVGDRKLLSVYNTGEGIKESDTEKIFERFYRSDESRNRSTGGYGLGLAIAKSVIDKHKFKVHVLNQPGKSVCFMVTMQ